MVGGIQQLRGQNFAIFLTPPPSLRGQFLYPERGQKTTFFDPLPPPHLVHVVIEWPLLNKFILIVSDICNYYVVLFLTGIIV